MSFKFSTIHTMDNIIEPDGTFDFSSVSLTHPVGIQGGAYFTKIEYNRKPLYIQTSKSVTRQGFVKTGKRYYCDLMFDKNSETLINWFENLEERCHKLIYEKKDAWFQGNLEESDVETAFNPLIRVYKSGKYYLLRTNVKNNKADLPAVKIYNEKELMVDMSEVTAETELISIVEIQGIKFTSRSFQIELDLKQVMVIDNNPLFENCLIKTKRERSIPPSAVALAPEPLVVASLEEDLELDEFVQEQTQDAVVESAIEEPSLESDDAQGQPPVQDLDPEEPMPLDIEFEDLSENIEEDNGDELKEIDNIEVLSLEKRDDDDVLTLKKPNQVYFDLYKEARNKAKQAKRNAILAYLEAKNIKKTYLIENINDSDSEFDNEIDEVSESELEDL